MRSIFHTNLIWLMLLAVPIQGFAAASMMSCEPLVASAAPATQPHHHDHAQMLAGGERTHHQHQSTGDHHGTGKCGACAACCIGASVTAPSALVIPNIGVASERIVARDAFPSTIVPAYPDRPPQASFT